jgi:hypothetical protein
MAEKRSDYSDEAHQPKSREAGDPLAELARLIGQTIHSPISAVRVRTSRSTRCARTTAPRPNGWRGQRPLTSTTIHVRHRTTPIGRTAMPCRPIITTARYQEHDDRAQDHGTHERYAARDGAPADVGHGQEHQYDDRYRVAPLRPAITTATTITPTTATFRRRARRARHRPAVAAAC